MLSHKRLLSLLVLLVVVQPAFANPTAAPADERRDALGYPLSMDMMLAAQSGNIDKAKKLLAQGVTITPNDLRVAAGAGKIEMVTLLLNAGADVNARMIGGWSALGAAARYGDINLVQLLVNKGAKVDAEAVGQAVQVGHLDIAKYLLDKGANINEVYGADEKYSLPGKTILMSAAAGLDSNDHNTIAMRMIKGPTADQTDVIKFLLERGADVNEQNGSGETALSVATQNGHTDVVQLLLAKKSNGSNGQDFAALITAIQKGQADIVKLLLDNGAKTDHTLLTAARLGDENIVNLLLAKGAQVDENDHLSVEQVEEKLKADPRAKPDAAQLGEQARNNKFNHKGDNKAKDTLQAMAEAGDAHAQYALGSAMGFTQDGMKWVQKAADQDNPAALFMLGQAHAAGAAYLATHGGTKDKLKAETDEANKWFDRLLAQAQKGNAEAQFQYSMNKRSGDSIKWLQKAADQGYFNAELMLGMAYMSGKDGVNKDENEALKWLQKAADHGNGQAQQFLGDIYAKGTHGVPKDEKKALEWHLKAIDTGIEPISMFSMVYD